MATATATFQEAAPPRTSFFFCAGFVSKARRGILRARSPSHSCDRPFLLLAAHHHHPGKTQLPLQLTAFRPVRHAAIQVWRLLLLLPPVYRRCSWHGRAEPPPEENGLPAGFHCPEHCTVRATEPASVGVPRALCLKRLGLVSLVWPPLVVLRVLESSRTPGLRSSCDNRHCASPNRPPSV